MRTSNRSMTGGEAAELRALGSVDSVPSVRTRTPLTFAEAKALEPLAEYAPNPTWREGALQWRSQDEA